MVNVGLPLVPYELRLCTGRAQAGGVRLANLHAQLIGPKLHPDRWQEWPQAAAPDPLPGWSACPRIPESLVMPSFPCPSSDQDAQVAAYSGDCERPLMTRRMAITPIDLC